MNMVLNLILTYICLKANAAKIQPRVSNWKEATKNGLIKIPLSNPDGHAWFASLSMGSPMQDESICVFDNNHPLSLTFSRDCGTCPHWKYNHLHSNTY